MSFDDDYTYFPEESFEKNIFSNWEQNETVVNLIAEHISEYVKYLKSIGIENEIRSLRETIDGMCQDHYQYSTNMKRFIVNWKIQQRNQMEGLYRLLLYIVIIRGY